MKSSYHTALERPRKLGRRRFCRSSSLRGRERDYHGATLVGNRPPPQIGCVTPYLCFSISVRHSVEEQQVTRDWRAISATGMPRYHAGMPWRPHPHQCVDAGVDFTGCSSVSVGNCGHCPTLASLYSCFWGRISWREDPPPGRDQPEEKARCDAASEAASQQSARFPVITDDRSVRRISADTAYCRECIVVFFRRHYAEFARTQESGFRRLRPSCDTVICAHHTNRAGALRLHVHAKDDLSLHFRNAFDRADAFTDLT